MAKSLFNRSIQGKIEVFARCVRYSTSIDYCIRYDTHYRIHSPQLGNGSLQFRVRGIPSGNAV